MVVIPCWQWSPTPTGLWWLISVHCEILHFAVFLNETEKLDLWIRFACWPRMASAFPSILAGVSYRGARGLLKRIKQYIPSGVLLHVQCKQIVSLFYVCFNQEHWFYLWLPTKYLFLMRNTFCLFISFLNSKVHAVVNKCWNNVYLCLLINKIIYWKP